jgi:hypothetical protein
LIDETAFFLCKQKSERTELLTKYVQMCVAGRAWQAKVVVKLGREARGCQFKLEPDSKMAHIATNEVQVCVAGR